MKRAKEYNEKREKKDNEKRDKKIVKSERNML